MRRKTLHLGIVNYSCHKIFIISKNSAFLCTHLRIPLRLKNTMSKRNITFCTDIDKKPTLDEIATGINRDRSYILNKAVDAYLEIYQWQLKKIQN
jgi:hypothetical protein